MGTPLAQRIQDLLVSDTPSPAASLEEMIAWVHAREDRFFSHAELVQALEELHRTGWIRSEGHAYVLTAFDWTGERPLHLPDEADLRHAQERYVERMKSCGRALSRQRCAAMVLVSPDPSTYPAGEIYT